VAFGWLRVFSGSVWPVAVAHAVWNMAWELLSEMTAGDPDALEYLAGESGILPIAGLAVVAALLAWRVSVKTAAQPVA
jgi:membrane protease YdiL (CAAX protease family)